MNSFRFPKRDCEKLHTFGDNNELSNKIYGDTMKESVRPAAPFAAPTSRAEKRTATRFKLELLETLTAGQERRGYDPYNASDGQRSSDVWHDKPKRR